MLLLINLLLVVDHIESSAVVDIHLHSLGLAPSFVLLKVSCLYSTPFPLASVTVDLTDQQSLNSVCCFGWPSVMLFSSAGIWYIYLCDHSDRCNFTLEEEVHLQRDLAIKNSVLSPLVVYGETSRQGLARRSRRWTDEACRFMYFESITGSCSEKEGEKTSLGYRLLFVKYSNVNSILFFLGKSSIFTLELWQKSNFQSLTTKSDNKCHQTVKTGQIWPLGWFWRWFCIF